MSALIDQFTRLVKIDSPTGFEQEISDFLIDWLGIWGFEYTQDQFGNIYARREGIGVPMLFCVHQDTVEPGRGIVPTVKDGLICSSGNTILGADNKAAMAALLHAVETVPQAKSRSLELVFTVAEEGGLVGSSQFDYSQVMARFGVCFDKAAPIGTVVMQSAGMGLFDGEIRGKAAHVGTPEQGINALRIGIEVLSQITLGRSEDDVFINFSNICSGVTRNTVPELFAFESDIRSFDQKRLQDALFEIERLFRTTVENHGAHLVARTQLMYPAYKHQESTSNFKYLNTVFTKHGCTVGQVSSGGGSDANHFNAYGIEMFDLGDGTRRPHTTEEQISVRDLELLCEIMQSMIVSV